MLKEAEILSDIRNSEKKAEEIIEKAGIDSQDIVNEAQRNSLQQLKAKKDELANLQDRKVVDSRAEAEALKKEKLEEGMKIVEQMKKKAEKNIGKAVDAVMNKFEEAI